MDDHDEEKRREQNLIVRSGKSDAEVTNNSALRSTYYQSLFAIKYGSMKILHIFVY